MSGPCVLCGGAEPLRIIMDMQFRFVKFRLGIL